MIPRRRTSSWFRRIDIGDHRTKIVPHQIHCAELKLPDEVSQILRQLEGRIQQLASRFHHNLEGRG